MSLDIWNAHPVLTERMGWVIQYWGFPPRPVCCFGTLPFLFHEIPVHLFGEIDMSKVDYHG